MVGSNPTHRGTTTRFYKAYGTSAGSIPACFTMGRGPILLSNEGKTHKGVESFMCCHIFYGQSTQAEYHIDSEGYHLR